MTAQQQTNQNSHQTCFLYSSLALVLTSGHYLLFLGQDMEQDQILVWPGEVTSYTDKSSAISTLVQGE